MLYRVTREYERGGETLVAQFQDAADARLFIGARLLEDARLKVRITWRLFEGMDLLEQCGPDDAAPGAATASSAAVGGGSGAGQTSSFSPTPFNMAPRPGGIPHNWIKDKIAEKNQEKKEK